MISIECNYTPYDLYETHLHSLLSPWNVSSLPMISKKRTESLMNTHNLCFRGEIVDLITSILFLPGQMRQKETRF